MKRAKHQDAGGPGALQRGISRIRPGVLHAFVDATPHFVPCSAECGSDAVFGHAHGGADFLVGFAFEVIHADDFGFGSVETGQQLFDLIAIVDALFRVAANHRHFVLGAVVFQAGGRLLLEHFMDDHPPSDDCQVGCQAALAAKMAQNGQVLFDDGQEDLSDQIFAVFRREAQRAALGRMVDDVNDESHEAVDEVFPRSWLASEAALQEIAVDFGQCHEWTLMNGAGPL
jgi:hypothetical protein